MEAADISIYLPGPNDERIHGCIVYPDALPHGISGGLLYLVSRSASESWLHAWLSNSNKNNICDCPGGLDSHLPYAVVVRQYVHGETELPDDGDDDNMPSRVLYVVSHQKEVHRGLSLIWM